MARKFPALKTAIIGGGSIGVGFAVVFTRAGYSTTITDPDPTRRSAIPGELTARLRTLESYGLLEEPVEAISERLRVIADISDAVSGADLVQECVPEREDIKRPLFAQLAELTDDRCIVASSSSFMTTTTSAGSTGVESRALVAHPGNPPFAIPVIELVPNPQTRAEVVQRARALYAGAGMSPVLVNKECEGFIFNRLQGAILREAYALVRDGVASVDDVDTVVRDGLGRRWTFMGPFETVDLNTRGGISAHAKNMGPTYRRMGQERGDTSEWTPDLVAEVTSQRRQMLPLDRWEDRVAWRDEQLLNRLGQ
ncbi:3-hydroxyacyl-CoA dehydrogenase [Paeniglutamicibacter sp. MACA_103]|uniref:3-hydroxyacyl-CoA dehydrogenase n=1 Tax=Paeniglutamicibacter sp. MACA_103 TaxID=3377337 RepID=UPI0038956ADC